MRGRNNKEEEDEDAFWESLGALFEPLLGPPCASWGLWRLLRMLVDRLRGFLARRTPSYGPLWADLGPSWGASG
eukprot:2063013-Pyramimonas_sp.AAC.1